jgi:hypothetical protein
MAVASIITLILFIIIAVLVFKFIKNVVKSILIILSILVLLVIASGLFISADANDFRANFAAIPSLYLLETDGQIVAGIYGTFSEEGIPSLVGTEQLNSYQTSYQENDLANIKENYYKVFIIKSEAFDSITEVRTDGETMPKQAIIDLIDSSTPIDDFMEQRNIPQDRRSALMSNFQIANDDEFKSFLFTLLIVESIEEKGPLFIFTEFKQGNVIIYPESAITFFIKEIPFSLLNSLILRISGGE